MNHSAPKSAKWFGLYDDRKIVAILGVIHSPHPINKKMKRVTRMVVLPDYQGIGIGTKFLDAIAAYYSWQGFDFSITTSARNLVQSLCKNEDWALGSYGRAIPSFVASKTSTISMGNRGVNTYSFYYDVKRKQ